MLKMATKVAFTVMLAVVGLTAFSGGATASRSLSLSAAGNFLAISLGRLSFRTTVGVGVIAMECNVTLHGTLSRGAIAKRSGTLFGQIHSSQVRNCISPLEPATSVSASALVGTGWKLIYRTFNGRLPTPNGISAHVQNAAFLLDLTATQLRVACLYGGDIPITVNFSGSVPNTSGLITVGRHTTSLRTRLPTSAGDCPQTGELQGTFGLTPTQTLILIN